MRVRANLQLLCSLYLLLNLNQILPRIFPPSAAPPRRKPLLNEKAAFSPFVFDLPAGFDSR
jgi:hypothetical protein